MKLRKETIGASKKLHSSATWFIMANASMWCLPTNVHKEWCVGFYRNDKESHTFQWQKPLILQHDVDN